jgi:outer membrane lipoprotein SlyB
MLYLRSLGGVSRRHLVPVFGALLLASGCVNPTKAVYESRDVGRMIDTSEATVVSSRIVSIKEESRGRVPLAGAAVGATGAGLLASPHAGLAIALGGLIGAGAAVFAERSARSREGIEYVVRTSDGRVMMLVQNRDGSETPIRAGTSVIVQHGSRYTRVIEKPENLEEQWRNPDTPGNGGRGGGLRRPDMDQGGSGSNLQIPSGSTPPDASQQ